MSVFSKLFIDDIPDEDYAGKRIVLRVDYNVPMNHDAPENPITDDTRITATLPTLKYLLERNVKTITIISHMGRPRGEVVPKYSLKPVADRLASLLEVPIAFVDDCGDRDKVTAAVEGGGVVMLENVRFYAQEESKAVDSDEVKEFRALLSSYGDIFVNDAFAACHRSHSSMVGVTLPVRAAGFLLKKELVYFGKALENPSRPFLAILGGAKVDTKITLIENLLDKVDEMLIGGGMVFTFKKVIEDMEIGKSLFDEAGAAVVPKIMAKAAERNVKIHLATDFVCGDNFAEDAAVRVVTDQEGIPAGWMGMDVGPQTQAAWTEVVGRAKTIIWNGPPGVFEWEAFRGGSTKLVEALVETRKAGMGDDGTESVATIICGGDTAVLSNKFSSPTLFSHVSTGGGASLELCEGKVLPGCSALSDK